MSEVGFPEKDPEYRSEEDIEIDASRAPLMEHLIELRSRLIKSLIAIAISTVVCFYFAGDIFNLLLRPFEIAAGHNASDVKLIFTAPQEYFFTQLKLAMFGAIFVSFPILASQIYMFVAPGLYKNERHAFLPFLIATPILFLMGAALVYFMVMPLAFKFFLSMQQAGGDGKAAIELLPRVSEYLSLIMSLILAFGFCFQLPVLLTLLGKVGIVDSQMLKKGRRYAIVASFAVAAVLTPPDLLSQISLGLPTLVLYEISIWTVWLIERNREKERKAREQADAAAP
ncbi:MAG: twin-arginine translocase subunit TatC [Parvibaculaceae bacterium]|nr:twin-arginine translocase subunit TatC [Parvibaculaceae bacterium]